MMRKIRNEAPWWQLVIPANAGIQQNQGAGHRLSPVWRPIQCFARLNDRCPAARLPLLVLGMQFLVGGV